VAKNCRIGIRYNTKNAFGLQLPIEIEAAVNARHDKIEAREHAIGVIERATRQDVGLDTFEDMKALTVARAKPVDLGMLLIDFIYR
jgi:hypothetical protein